MFYKLVTGPVRMMFDHTRPHWPLVRSHARLAAMFVTGWSLVLPLMVWMGRIFDGSFGTRWESAFAFGLGSITLFSGGFFGLAMFRNRSAKALHATDPSKDRAYCLEVRALSYVVDGGIDAIAWEELRDFSLRRERKKAALEPVHNSDHLASALSRGQFLQAFKRIAPSLPSAWPIPALIWPPGITHSSRIDPSTSALELIDYGHTFRRIDLKETLSKNVMEAAFEVFDKDESVPALLIVSADGIGFNNKAAIDVTPNAALLFLVQPERLDMLIKQTAVAKKKTAVTETLAMDGVSPDERFAKHNQYSLESDLIEWTFNELIEVSKLPRMASIFHPSSYSLKEPTMRGGLTAAGELQKIVVEQRWSGSRPPGAEHVLLDFQDQEVQDRFVKALREIRIDEGKFGLSIIDLGKLKQYLGSGNDLIDVAYAVSASREYEEPVVLANQFGSDVGVAAIASRCADSRE